MPIAGDSSKLPYAEGLDAFARSLARKVNFISETLPGNQIVRKMMGHCEFGARIMYGDSIFITISPNEQHSALVLRLIRNRANDPMLYGTDPVDVALRGISGLKQPCLEADSNDEVLIHIYIYAQNRQWGRRAGTYI